MKRRVVKMLVITAAMMLALSNLCGCSNTSSSEEVVSTEVQESTMETEEVIVETETSSSSEETSETVEASAEPTVETSSEVAVESSSAEDTKQPTEAVASSEQASAPSNEQPKEEVPAYTVDAMDKTMYAQNAVNLREGPSTDYAKAGSLAKGEEVHVIGQASTGWYQLETGLFVSNSYLGDSAPVITPEPVPQPGAQAPAQENNNTNTGSSSNNSSESGPTFVLADDGYWKDGVFHPFNNGGSSSGSSSSEPVSQPETQVPVEEVYTYDIYLVSDLLTLVNNQRTANGVAAFTWNSSREEDAKVRARELVDSFTHSSPSGITSGGECITQNGPSAQTIYNAYSGSEMHFTSLTVMEINTTFVSANCDVYVNGEYRTTYNVILMD